MKAVVEPLEGNKVKLTSRSTSRSSRRPSTRPSARSPRRCGFPGFRPGKAPRRILEARLGKESGRSEALRDALPDYYSQALREHEVDAIAPPEIDITAGQESGPVAFDAVVEVRPQLHLAGYERPAGRGPEPGGDRRGDRRPGRPAAGQLRRADRRSTDPARDGDHLTIDLKGSRDGQRCRRA